MRMARSEREQVRKHFGRVPGHVSQAALAFAREHPLLATGGAVALGLALFPRGKKSEPSTSEKKSALTAMLGAFAVRLLPELLKMTAQAGPPSTSSPSATAQRN